MPLDHRRPKLAIASLTARETMVFRFLIVICSLFTVNLVFYVILRVAFKSSYPFQDYFYRPQARFSDFKRDYYMWNGVTDAEKEIYRAQATTLDPFPIWNLWHFPFNLIPREGSALICYTVSGFLCIASGIFNLLHGVRRSLRLTSATLFTLLSYPSQFVLERGNVEFVAFLFACLYLRFRRDRPILSVLFLAMSIGVKPWMIVLIILELKERNFLRIVMCGVTYIVEIIAVPLILRLVSHRSLANFWSLQPQRSHFGNYNETYNSENLGVAFGHSLYGALKIVIQSLSNRTLEAPPNFARTYSLAILLLFLLLLIFIRVDRVSIELGTVLLVLMAIFAPFVSADYKLLYVFIALGLSMSAVEKIPNLMKWSLMIPLAALASGKSFIRLDLLLNLHYPDPVMSGVIISPLLAVGLAIQFVRIAVSAAEPPILKGP